MPATHKVLLGVDLAQLESDMTVIHVAVPCTGSAGGMRLLQEAAEGRLRPVREGIEAFVRRTLALYWKYRGRTVSARRARALRRKGVRCVPAAPTRTGKARYTYTRSK